MQHPSMAGTDDQGRPWYFIPEKPPRKLKRQELASAVERLHTVDRYGFLAARRGHVTGDVQTDEEHPDGFFLRVGPCWVPQRRLKPSEIDEIVDRLNVVKKAAKAAEEPPPPPAMRLSYKHDAGRGSGFKAFQEVLVPVKKMRKEEKTEALRALADRCSESHANQQKKLEETYLQPIVQVKKIPREQQAAHEHAFDRLAAGLGVVNQ